MSICFCLRPESFENCIIFGLAAYDKENFQQIAQQLQAPRHRYRFSVDLVVELAFLYHVIGDITVVHLEVDVIEGRSNEKKPSVWSKFAKALR